MAGNVTSIQVLVDGPRNCVVKFEGILDTSDLSSTDVVDPAARSAMTTNGTKATTFRIKKITHNIEDGLAVNLFWDATTPVRIESLTGRGNAKYGEFGGLINNAGATGFTGKITATTQGWSASSTLSFSVILELIKVQ